MARYPVSVPLILAVSPKGVGVGQLPSFSHTVGNVVVIIC